MTTQATQSSTALGRRSLPSSFFAPLQTLGRYIDRQKGDGPDATDELGDLELTSNGSADAGPGYGLASDGQQGEVSRLDDDGREGASWQDLWEDRSSAAGTVPSPDPEAVRNAISRLARGAQWPQPGSASGPNSAALPALAETEPVETKSVGIKSAGTETAAFAVVARRVWSEVAPESAAPRRANEESRILAPAGGRDIDLAELHMESLSTAPSHTPDLHTSDLRTSDLHSTDPHAPQVRMTGGQAQERLQGLPTGLDLGPATGFDTTPDTRSGSAEAHALAHDASNLLSALRLYSELLCFSGVLHERHRHYAEDLKLLSQRSGRLIDRLMHLAHQVAAAERPAFSERPAFAARPAVAAPAFSTQSTVPSIEARLAQPGPLGPVPLGADSLDAGCSQVRSTLASVCIPSERPGPELVGAVGTGGSDDTGLDGNPGSNLDGEVGSNTLGEVVMRLRGVLGTIARGALVVDLGPMAAVPVAVPVEALERVLVNLVSNAAAAICNGGAVRVRAGVPHALAGDSIVVLTVDDSGCGMSEAQLRSALGHPAEDGTGPSAAHPKPAGPQRTDVQSGNAQAGRRHGLGLSIVRELVQTHGGTLSIQSRPGTGTRIEVHWQAVAGSNLLAIAPEFFAARQGPASTPLPVRRSALPSQGGTAHAGLRQAEFVQAGQGAARQAEVQGAVA